MQKLGVVLFGSSGLVGSKVRQLLTPQVAQGKIDLRCPGRTGPEAIDFNNSDHLAATLLGAHIVVWCLGTTIKKAQSKEQFAAIDLALPSRVFELAKASGVLRVFLISAEGANPSSLIFYSRIKGLLEAKLEALNFSESVVYRPSLLLGHRSEKRWAEGIAQSLSQWIPWSLIPGLKNVQPVTAEQVASALARDLLSAPRVGHRVCRNWDLIRES